MQKRKYSSTDEYIIGVTCLYPVPLFQIFFRKLKPKFQDIRGTGKGAQSRWIYFLYVQRMYKFWSLHFTKEFPGFCKKKKIFFISVMWFSKVLFFPWDRIVWDSIPGGLWVKQSFFPGRIGFKNLVVHTSAWIKNGIVQYDPQTRLGTKVPLYIMNVKH